jgi:hypothetical protein
MSTITTRPKRCASSGSMGNSSETQYPPQSTWSSAMPCRETSHKSSADKPVGPRPAPQRSEGKMPTLEGVNPGDFEVDDSNIERDSHVALHHRLEPHEPILPCPYPFVALSPSKDQPRSGFPKHNVGSWLQLVALYMGLGAFWPPWPWS